MDTSYLPIVNDSIGLLSPRAQAYFKNYSFPRGVVPVVQTVDSIPAVELGTFANDAFDDIADTSPDKYAFEKYGLLIVVSRHPELIQVRAGSEYSKYLSMKGVTAGYGYLQMQKGIIDKGIEKSFPLFVDCACNEVMQCQNLSWFQKYRIKCFIGLVSDILSDWGTPSDTLFNQIYFRPALVVLTFFNSLLNNWFLALLVIIFVIWAVRALLATWLRKGLNKFSDDEYTPLLLVSIFKKIFALIVSLPTLASFTMLANSRMEDYLAMTALHIPFLELTDWSDKINNVVAPIWMIAIGAFFFYLRHIIREDGSLIFAFLPADIQRNYYKSSEKIKNITEILLKGGLLRRNIYPIIMKCFSNEMTPDANVELGYNEEDYENFNKAFFHDEDSQFFKTNPYTAISVNNHREMLFYMTIFIIGATLICPTPMVMYFIAIWFVSTIWRLREFYKLYKILKISWKILGDGAKSFFKSNWISYICFAILLFALTFLQPLKSVEVKDNIEINTIKGENITGRYFVKQAGEGLTMQGASAKIDSISEGRYLLYVYSEYLTREYELTYDEETSLFESVDIGTGTLEYDKDINKITIKFSTGWIFTK